MAIGTYFAMGFELLFLFLVFSPFYRGYTKLVGLLAGISLHGGIAATVNVGLFSYLMPTAYLCFLEPAWTEKVLDQLARFTRKGPVVVLYDGECPMCRRGMRMLRAMDRFGNLKYVDFRSEDLPATRTPLSKAAMAKRMHAVSPDGTVTEGFLAFQTIFRCLPATFAVAPFMGLPVIDWIGGGIYDWVADRRLQLSGPCTDANCVINAPKPKPPLLGDGARNFFATLLHLGITTLFISAAWYSCPQQGSRNLPVPLSRAVQWFSLWNVWDMFSPEPLRTDYHLRAVAEYSDGSTEDLFGGPADGPGEVRGFFFTRWWKYLENVTGGGETIPREWGRWQCRIHNERSVGGRKLYTFTLKKENQIIPPIGQPWPPVENIDVWIHRCYDKPGDRKVGK
jgi:predicted DCC family thiol-disulfide oxidoreductase YuxK